MSFITNPGLNLGEKYVSITSDERFKAPTPNRKSNFAPPLLIRFGWRTKPKFDPLKSVNLTFVGVFLDFFSHQMIGCSQSDHMCRSSL